MIDLAELLYKNMTFIVSWIFRSTETVGKSVESLFKNVSLQIAISQAKLPVFIEALDSHSKMVVAKLNIL